MKLMKMLAVLTAGFCALTLPGLGVSLEGSSSTTRVLVQTTLSSPKEREDLERLGLEIVSEIPGTVVQLLAGPDQIETLRAKGYSIEILGWPAQPQTQVPAFPPEYHTYDEVVAELQMLQALYPTIGKLYDLGPTTQLGRRMWAFKVSDNVAAEEDEPAVLYDGEHHACEVMGLELCLNFLNDLLSGYGSNPTITNWVDNTEIWFVPAVNPDGHYAVTNGISDYWRKNGREIDGDTVLFEYQCNNWWTCYTEGVNENRNYDWNWSSGGSSDPWHYDYRGASPFSERETQAMRDLSLAQHFSLSISFHSYGEIVYYPWQWGPSRAPDDACLSDIASNVASRMAAYYGGHYTYGTDDALTGMSSNWRYGATGDFALMIETLPYPYFIPPGSWIAEAYADVRPGMTYLLDRVRGSSITGKITDAVSGLPLEARVQVREISSSNVDPRRSEPLHGRYRWPLNPGTYSLEVSRDGYVAQTITNISVVGGTPTTVDVALQPVVLTIALTPDATTIRRGGTLGLTIAVTNDSDVSQRQQVWTEVTMPSGHPYPGNPVIGPVTRTFQPHQTQSQHVTHTIPVNAPLGDYTYTGKVGTYPGTVIDEDSFTFTVVP